MGVHTTTQPPSPSVLKSAQMNTFSAISHYPPPILTILLNEHLNFSNGASLSYTVPPNTPLSYTPYHTLLMSLSPQRVIPIGPVAWPSESLRFLGSLLWGWAICAVTEEAIVLVQFSSRTIANGNLLANCNIHICSGDQVTFSRSPLIGASGIWVAGMIESGGLVKNTTFPLDFKPSSKR